MSRKESLLILAFLALCLWFCASNAQFSKYNIEDDCHYVKMANPSLGYFNTYEAASPYYDFVSFIKKFNLESGRFRPLSTSFFWIVGKVAGENYLGKGMLMFLVSLAVLGLFYFLMRSFQVNVFLSFTFSLLFLTGRYHEIFFRRTGEIVGLMFLLAGLLAFRALNNSKRIWISVLFFSAAALSKESFAALLPAVGMACVLMNSERHKISFLQSAMEMKSFLFWLSLPLVLSSVFAFIAMQRPTGYSFSGKGPLLFAELLRNALNLAGPLLLWIPVVSSMISLFIYKKVKHLLLPISLVFILCFSSQIIVYLHSDTTNSRYLVPCGLFLLFVSALSLKYLESVLPKKSVLALYVLLIAMSGVQAKNMIGNASYFKARTDSYHTMLDTVAGIHLAPADTIYCIMEEGAVYDFFESTAVFLSQRKVNNPIRVFELRKDATVRAYNLKNLITRSSEIINVASADSSVFFSKMRTDTNVRAILFTSPSPSKWFSLETALAPSFRKLSFPYEFLDFSFGNLVSTFGCKKNKVSYNLFLKDN